MKEFTILTVQHTGTTFTIRLLNRLGIKMPQWRQVHAQPTKMSARMKTIFDHYVYPENRPLIVTARDPYLSSLRILKDPGISIENVADHWNTFLDIIETRSHFVVDIACRKKDRLVHLQEMLAFIDASDYDNKIVTNYAENWVPVNSAPRNRETRDHYIETGELPEQYDWSHLDRAVEWYKSLPTNDE